MTLEEIENLQLEDLIHEIIPRILDASVVPDGEPVYQLDLDEEKDFYERIMFHPSIIKPTAERVIEELDEIKEGFRVTEQARLDEVARVVDITNRFNGIADIRGAIYKASLDIPNPEVELKRIITENDQDRLSELEQAGLD